MVCPLFHRDRLVLDAAIAEARAGLADGGIPIGAALLSRDDAVVARGRNLRVQTGDPTAHAEMVCMKNAGRRRDWHTLTLATTLSPCAMCTGAAVLHKIARIVIGDNTTFQGREDWLAAEGIEVLLASDPTCAELMRRFIAEHPDLWDEDIGTPPPSPGASKGFG